jgi:hypothetical protein
MTTSTSATSTTSRPTSDRREAAREQAALARLQAAVTTMRAWRHLADPPATHPARTGRPAHARDQARER